MPPGADAAIFYVSVAALVVGCIRTVRASVERGTRDRVGVILAVAGGVGLLVAVIAFIAGPKSVLPF